MFRKKYNIKEKKHQCHFDNKNKKKSDGFNFYINEISLEKTFYSFFPY